MLCFIYFNFLIFQQKGTTMQTTQEHPFQCTNRTGPEQLKIRTGLPHTLSTAFRCRRCITAPALFSLNQSVEPTAPQQLNEIADVRHKSAGGDQYGRNIAGKYRCRPDNGSPLPSDRTAIVQSPHTTQGMAERILQLTLSDDLRIFPDF